MVSRVRQRTKLSNWASLGTFSVIGGSTYSFAYNSPFREKIADSTHKGPPFKSGGGMSLDRYEWKFTPSAHYSNTLGLRVANCQFIPSYYGYDPKLGGVTTWSKDLSVLGSEGWKRARPDKPGANVGQFLGELGQLPMLPLRKILSARNLLQGFKSAGSEYLNVVFGWQPFLQDLRDMYHLTQNLDKRLSQLRRDNGKPIRRKVSVTNEADSSSVTSTGLFLYPTLTTEFYPTPFVGARTVTTGTTSRTWFSARFRYFVRDINSVRWSNRAVQALFGLNPTPSLLWELLPFSWLIDWGFNVGTVLSNLSESAVDNLVADYAFIMQHRESYVHVDENTLMYKHGGGTQTISASVLVKREQKLRQQASPYGFGIVPGDLSDRQALILGALGISRHW